MKEMWNNMKERLQRVPSYIWLIVLLAANALACLGLYQSCEQASGRSVDDSLFNPNATTTEEEEMNALLKKPATDSKADEEEKADTPADTTATPAAGMDEYLPATQTEEPAAPSKQDEPEKVEEEEVIIF